MGKGFKIIYTPAGKADEYARSERYPDDPPIAANLYAGCVHGCTYCYAPGVLRRDRHAFHSKAVPKDRALERFAHDCELLKERGNKAPIFMSFTTDPYQPCERRFRLTRHAIMAAHQAGQNVNILTKAGDPAAEDFHMLHSGDIFGISLTTRLAIDEPCAASPAERMMVLREAHDRGIQTRVSFEPILDLSETLSLIEQVRPYTDLIQVGRWNHDRRADGMDWPTIAREVRDLLELLGGEYYLKNDLRKYLEADDG
jgi:DNA repair photolyase